MEKYISHLKFIIPILDKTSSNPVLFEKILDELEGKEFKCTTENDSKFIRISVRLHGPIELWAFDNMLKILM